MFILYIKRLYISFITLVTGVSSAGHFTRGAETSVVRYIAELSYSTVFVNSNVTTSGWDLAVSWTCLQLVSGTGPDREMRCNEAPFEGLWISRTPLVHAWRTISGMNETKRMWKNGEMKFLVGENERNPEKNLPRLGFVHEAHMEWPRRELGRRRASNLLRHGEATHV